MATVASAVATLSDVPCCHYTAALPPLCRAEDGTVSTPLRAMTHTRQATAHVWARQLGIWIRLAPARTATARAIKPQGMSFRVHGFLARIGYHARVRDQSPPKRVLTGFHAAAAILRIGQRRLAIRETFPKSFRAILRRDAASLVSAAFSDRSV